MNKESVFVGSDLLGPAGQYQQTEVTLYFTPQATAATPVANNTVRTLCTSDGAPFVLPRGAVLARIVAMPAPYETRGTHIPTASGATPAALNSAYIRLQRREVEKTVPFTLGAGNYIRVHSPEDATVAMGTADTKGWVTNECDIRLGPRLATGQAFAVFGGWPDTRGAINPAGTEADFTGGGATLFAHKSTQQDTKTFINLPTAISGQYSGSFPLESDVSVTLTYRLPLTTFTVVEYEPFPPKF